ncbi:hypothetical protein PRIPAC_86717 [Pristionchus pacificus]|uniref:Uncharacterized protein n=1 Tax=Pristionchus pacificus TaxID=54126 RepID=A0A2A6BLK8_PRIPA|nr:hypothetical protein PRIPAC_86717 [Pristionchus pacificus]|eukprot:PDM66795.1 hypothetical protein PRIPAC_48212 [Pristionchus pacificus]
MDQSDALTLSNLPADIIRKFISLVGSEICGEMRLHFCYMKNAPPIDHITIRNCSDNFCVLFRISKKNAHYYLPLYIKPVIHSNTPGNYNYLSISTKLGDEFLTRINQCMSVNAATVQFESNDTPENHIISIMRLMCIGMFCLEILRKLEINDGRNFLLEVASHVAGISINHRYGYLFGISDNDISTLLLQILERKTSAIWIPCIFESELDDRAALDKFAKDVASLGKKVWMVISTQCFLDSRFINQHSIWTNRKFSLMHIKHISRRGEHYTW